jgi:WD40 repeat protein/serine/threonine protein kinase
MAADLPSRPAQPTKAPLAEELSATSAHGPGSARKPPSIPDYELLRCIGSGSYGEVWLARNVFGEHRAVKIVYRRDFTDDRPFHREFEGIKKFEPISRSHPSQLSILHAGKNDTAGYFYYIMELADSTGNPNDEWRNPKETRSPKAEAATAAGEFRFSEPPSSLVIGHWSLYSPHTLRADLEQHGRLPVAWCIEIGLLLTTALAHLHKHGLVHRDIKPSNIIFVRGIPKLADIGLVTDVGDAKSIVGTEGYLAPEGPGSPQADIYSLGKVLYEISMGRDRRHFPDLPLDWQDNPDRARLLELNEILLKACAQDGRERYRSAEEMQADLALLQSGQSIQRLRTAERRLHFAKQAGCVAAALLLVATGGFVYQQSQTRRIEREKKIAEQERRVAEQLLYAADTSLAQQSLEAGNLVRATTILEAYRPKPSHEDLRGFEWYYLKNLCRGDEAHTFRAHEQPVKGVAISRDGKLLASCSDDQTIKLWDLFSRAHLATLKGHTSAVNAIAFSTDGTKIASGGVDKTVKLWEVSTRTVLAEFTNHADAVTSVAFQADAKRLIAGTDGTSAKLWDVATGDELYRFDTPDGGANLVAVSPDGKWLALAGNGLRVRLWNFSTLQPAPDLYHEGGNTWGLAFSPDSKVLAATRSDGVVLWDFRERRVLRKLTGHERETHPVVFSRDGRLLASGSEDTTVRLWDLESRQSPRIFKGHTEAISGLAFSPDGQVLVSGSGDHTVKLWELSPKEEPDVLRGHADSVSCVAFSPDDRTLASASKDGTVKLWDVARGTPLATLTGHTAGVTGVEFTRDGTELFSCGLDQTIRLWDMHSYQTVKIIAGRKGHSCLALDPNGRTLVSGSGWWDDLNSPCEITFWDCRSWVALTNLTRPSGMVRKLEFSPDGQTLAVGYVSDPILLELLNVASKQSVFASTNLGAEMAFSPDGKTFAASDSMDVDRISVLDFATRRMTSRLHIPGPATRYKAFSPDGLTLAVFYATAKIKLCNVVTGREVATLQGHETFGMHLAFSHDGQTLASGSNDRTIRLWRAPK